MARKKKDYVPPCEDCASKNGCKLITYRNDMPCGYFMSVVEGKKRIANSKRDVTRNGI